MINFNREKMKMWEKYTFKLETLTPLNIGDGSRWFPFEYWKENGKLIIVDFDRFIDYIFSQNNWEELFNKLDELFSNEEKYYTNKRFEANFNVILEELGLEDKKEEFKPKPFKLKYVKDLEDRGGEVKKEIIKFVREKGKLLIPGSSIKGALRTAFIYHNVFDKDIINVYREREKKKATSYVNKKFNFDDKKNILVRDVLVDKETEIHLIKRLGMGKSSPLNGIEVIEINDKDNIEVEIQVRRNMEEVMREVNNFSLTSINAILGIDSVKKDEVLVSELDKIKNEISERMEEGKEMIFQLGSGGDYFSKSIGEKIMKLVNKDIIKDKKSLLSLRKKLDFGKNPKTKNFNLEFPKTFSVNQDNKPFGWIKLTMKK